MNDLEHDLRELFDQRASGVEVPGLAPMTVLKRGRRRQVGTVVMGALACIIALSVAAVAIGQARHPAVIPEGNGLPERVTSIGGVPVTAPAGWTLVDDWPLAAILATSQQTCSFSATGAAVDSNGSPVDVGPSATPVGDGSGGDTGTSSSGEACTQESSTSETSVPLLQLANFTVPLTKTLCTTDLGAPTDVPSDEVAVYVGVFPGGTTRASLLSSCSNASTLSFGPLQGPSGAVVAAIAIEGPDARGSDRAVAEDFVNGFDPSRMTMPVPTAGTGPGYVFATGAAGGTSWRLEAGITSLHGGDAPHVGAIMVATSASGDEVRTVELPTNQHVADDAVDLGDGHVVQFGTATADVTDISIDRTTGDAVVATMFAWPAPIALPNMPTRDGWVWFAETPERGDVHATFPSTPPTAPIASEKPPAERLQTTTDDQGRYTIFGSDFGHEWSFHREQDGSFTFFLDGADQAQGGVLTSGAVVYFDIPGGTLALALEPSSLKRLFMTSDVAGDDVVANGAWAPSSLGSEQNTRVWVLSLPGSGSGYEWDGSRLPLAIDWPTNPSIRPGDQTAAGSTPIVSWVEVWSDQRCPTFQVVAAVDDGDLGSSPCPTPWNAQDYANRTSYIGGVYGQEHATVWMLGPAGMQADATSPDAPKVGGYCGGSIGSTGAWAKTGECVFVIPVGQTWVINPTLQDGTPLADTITITAHPGRIQTSQAEGAGSATASASP